MRTIPLVITYIVIGFFVQGSSIYAQQRTTAQLQRAEEYIEQAKEYYAQAEYKASIKEYQFAAAIYRKLNRAERYAVCYNGVGNNYINLSRYKEAYKEFNRGLVLFKELKSYGQVAKLDSSIIADSYEGLGRYYMNMDVDFAKALYYHQEAIRLRILNNSAKDKTALSYYYIGLCYRHFSRDSSNQEGVVLEAPIAQELSYLNKALKLQQKTVGENHHQTADTYAALGNHYDELYGDYQKGFEYHEKALAIREQVFRKDHPKIAESYLDMAAYFRGMNMFEEEQNYLEKALIIQQNAFGEEHQAVAKSYFLLGNRNNASGDYEKALDYYKQALRVFLKLLTENSVEVAEIYKQIALCYRGLKEPRQELKYLKKTRLVKSKIYGNSHFKMGEIFLELGSYFGEQQAYDSLLYYYEKATNLWKKQLGDNHYYVAMAYDKMAEAYRLRNESEKEFFYLNEALSRKVNVKKTNGDRLSFGKIEDVDINFEMDENNIILGAQLFDSYMNLASFYKRKRDYRCRSISESTFD